MLYASLISGGIINKVAACVLRVGTWLGTAFNTYLALDSDFTGEKNEQLDNAKHDRIKQALIVTVMIDLILFHLAQAAVVGHPRIIMEGFCFSSTDNSYNVRDKLSRLLST